MGFDSIIGQEGVVRYLKDAVRTGKISHAYLISGDRGSGKKTVADAFAAALECRVLDDDACGKCPDCQRVMHGTHPDVVHIRPVKGLISVDQVREDIVRASSVKPYSGKYRIFIVENAETMNQQAQNALLKTLEEPPAYAVILLLSLSAEALLPTVVSRCVRLDLRAVPDDKISRYLVKSCAVSEYEANLAASYAQGNIGRALEAATSAEFSEMIGRTVYLLKQIHELPLGEMIMFIREMTNEKEKAQEFLDILTLWFRDVLMFKATFEVDRLIFKNDIAEIRQQAIESSYPGLEKILDRIDAAGQRLRANVSFDLTMELLLLAVRENMND